jgi:hypothetical protein
MLDGPLAGLSSRPHLQRFERKQSVELFVRHIRSCSHRQKGRHFRKCACPKYLYIYKDGTASRVSAKSGSWAVADKKAQEVRDSWIPELAELKRLRAEKSMGRLGIEESALNSFWMWDPAQVCWVHIQDWEDHKRRQMEKFDGYLNQKNPGIVMP